MYSQDPNGQEPELMVITGSWGLAKQVVDGTGKTDRFLVSRDSGEVVDQSISDKETMVVSRKEQGIDTVSVSDDLRSEPCLNAEQIRTLTAYARSLEQHFGKPQDIEWTVDATGLVILLQTRPLRVFTHETRKSPTPSGRRISATY